MPARPVSWRLSAFESLTARLSRLATPGARDFTISSATFCSSSCSSAQRSSQIASLHHDQSHRSRTSAVSVCNGLFSVWSVSPPVSQAATTIEFTGSFGTISFSTCLQLGHSNRRCSNPRGPGLMRASIMGDVQSEHPGRLMDVPFGK